MATDHRKRTRVSAISFIPLKKVAQYNTDEPDLIDREFQTNAFEEMR